MIIDNSDEERVDEPFSSLSGDSMTCGGAKIKLLRLRMRMRMSIRVRVRTSRMRARMKKEAIAP